MNNLSLTLTPSCGKVVMSRMPAELGEVFRGFFEEYSIIKVKWRLYKQLFGDAECIDLLNRYAAHGFGVVQDVLIKQAVADRRQHGWILRGFLGTGKCCAKVRKRNWPVIISRRVPFRLLP